ALELPVLWRRPVRGKPREPALHDRGRVLIVEPNGDRLVRVRGKADHHPGRQLAGPVLRNNGHGCPRIHDDVRAWARAVAPAAARAGRRRAPVAFLASCDDTIAARLEIAGVADAVPVDVGLGGVGYERTVVEVVWDAIAIGVWARRHDRGRRALDAGRALSVGHAAALLLLARAHRTGRAGSAVAVCTAGVSGDLDAEARRHGHRAARRPAVLERIARGAAADARNRRRGAD